MIALTLGLHLVLPILLSVWVARGRSKSRVAWLTDALLTTTLIGLLHVAGAGWPLLGTFWRAPLWIAIACAWILPLRRVASLPWWPTGWRGWVGWLPSLLGLVALAYSAPDVLRARSYDGSALALEFPLRDGAFHVAQGGATALVNAHHASSAQRYALDIVAVDGSGRSARGLRPSALDAYVIWAQSVRAPCDGVIAATTDGLPDLPIGARDALRPAGNHVVLHCGGHTVLLAHLRQRSVRVRPSMAVSRGQVLGEVGNSGNTSEPHLHIHAVAGRHRDLERVAFSGRGAPLTFEGRFLVRNDQVVR